MEHIERKAEESPHTVIVFCEVGTRFRSGMGLRKGCIFVHSSIHPTCIELYGK